MGNDNSRLSIPHHYTTFSNASGRMFRLCTACGETSELQLVEEADKQGEIVSTYFAWFPCKEMDENGKPSQTQRNCVGEARSQGRDSGGNSGSQATVVRRS